MGLARPGELDIFKKVLKTLNSRGIEGAEVRIKELDNEFNSS